MLAFRMKAWLPPPATELQVNVGIIIADKRNAVKLTAHVNNQGNMPIQIKYYIKIGCNNNEKKKRNFTDDNNYDDIEKNWCMRNALINKVQEKLPITDYKRTLISMSG